MYQHTSVLVQSKFIHIQRGKTWSPNPIYSADAGQFRAYSQRLPMPGGWVPTVWDFRPFHGKDDGTPNRIAFISIGSSDDIIKELEFQPKKVAPGVILSHSQFYRQQQSWFAWLLCLDHSDTVVYPVSLFLDETRNYSQLRRLSRQVLSSLGRSDNQTHTRFGAKQ
jgi:hypothetical protein